MSIKSLELVLENCDSITIPIENIHSFYADKISNGFMFVQEQELNYKVAGNVHLQLKPSANVEYNEFDMDDLKTEVFDRLLRGRDIVSVEIHKDNNETESIYVDWKDEDSNGCTNAYQKNIIDDDGNLIVKIGAAA